MKKITIEFPQGDKLEGMVDIVSEDFHINYTDMITHHGLQCNFDGDNIKHKLIMSFCKRITESAREIIKLNEVDAAQASVARDDDSSTSAGNQKEEIEVLTKEQFVKWFYGHSPYWPTPDQVYDKLTAQYFDGGLMTQKILSESKYSSLLKEKEQLASDWKQKYMSCEEDLTIQEKENDELEKSLKEKEDEIKALKNIRDVQNEVMLQNNQNYQKCVQENSQLQSSLDKYKALADLASEVIKVMDIPKNYSDKYLGNSQFDMYRERNHEYQTLKQQL